VKLCRFLLQNRASLGQRRIFRIFSFGGGGVDRYLGGGGGGGGGGVGGGGGGSAAACFGRGLVATYRKDKENV
jgi:hypothetical protein